MSTENPLVSVLIPGFKPQWLDLCINSCVNQSYKNIEILVGDDSDDGSISDIAEKWLNFGVAIYRNNQKSAGVTNRWNLFEKSSGKYIKYVYDDDFLFPTSVEELVKASERHAASMSFHQRLPIGPNGQRLSDLPSITAPTGAALGQSFEVPSDFIYKNIINNNKNLIGEPSNCIFRRDILQKELDNDEDFFRRKMLFLGDIKSYLNASLSDQPVVFINCALSAFRIHDQQASVSPIRPAGFYEWDIIRRYVFSLGCISQKDFEVGLANQAALYERMECGFSLTEELIRIAKNSRYENDYLDGDFREAIANADKILS